MALTLAWDYEGRGSFAISNGWLAGAERLLDGVAEAPEHGRLLLMHALYRGEERRTRPRLPLGYRVVAKIGMRRRDALLVDLSESGCRLLVPEPVARDSKITVQVPVELCGDERFILLTRLTERA